MGHWLELLTDRQRSSLQKWEYSVDDPSITTRVLSPFWNTAVTWVPDYVAPNVLTISGLLMILFAYHITNEYFAVAPRLISGLSALLIFTYQTLDAIDGKHARLTKNSSPLGELFDHACDSVGTMFVILTVARTLGIHDPVTLFYITQSGMFLFLLEHLDAFRTRRVEFSTYTGPGELLVLCLTILLWRAVTGTGLPAGFVESSLFNYTIYLIYAGIFWFSYANIAFGIRKVSDLKGINASVLMTKLSQGQNYGTRFGLLLCMLMRTFNGVLLFFRLIHDWSYEDCIAHGLIVSVIISDLIVAKMAQRQLHPMVVIMSMVSVFNFNQLIFGLVIAYFLRMFYEICDATGLMLFTPAKNVYICGVWDLLHLGHMQHFAEVAKLGNRVFVGVHSDQEVASYKRTPTLSMQERLDTAIMCKGVSKVIADAPLVLTKEFIKQHNIHVVGCSVEYDSPDDEYYKVAREMGILKVIPRVDGISTSELRKRTYESVKEQELAKKTE